MYFCYISWYPYIIIHSWWNWCKIIMPPIPIIKSCCWMCPWSRMITIWFNPNIIYSSLWWNPKSKSNKSFYNICSCPTRPWSSEAYIVVLLFSSKVFVSQYIMTNFLLHLLQHLLLQHHEHVLLLLLLVLLFRDTQ